MLVKHAEIPSYILKIRRLNKVKQYSKNKVGLNHFVEFTLHLV